MRAAGGPGRRAPPPPRPPGACGPSSANLSPRSPSRPRGGRRGRGGPRVSPRQGPGARRLCPRVLRDRRGMPAFQELAEPALHLLLRRTCGHRERASAAGAAPGAGSMCGPPPAPSLPCPPPPRTCAPLRDQLAGSLGDGVHGAEGPQRARALRALPARRPAARSRALRPAGTRLAPRARPL